MCAVHSTLRWLTFQCFIIAEADTVHRSHRETDTDCRTLMSVSCHLQIIFLEDFVAELLPDLHPNYHGIVETMVCSMAARCDT